MLGAQSHAKGFGCIPGVQRCAKGYRSVLGTQTYAGRGMQRPARDNKGLLGSKN